jgi:Gpi18-like mannosyltransferase
MLKIIPHFKNNNKLGVIIFSAFSVLWLGLCLLLILPPFQSLVLNFAVRFAGSIGKTYPLEELTPFLKTCAFAGFAFYGFIIFLIAIENFIIKRPDIGVMKWEILFMVIVSSLAMVIRITGFNQLNGDIITQLQWLEHFRENGFFEGYRTFPGNYTAIYLYILSILSFIPQGLELYFMKIISCFFDFICAIYAMKIMEHFLKNKKISLLTYAIILFSPTVFLNSGTWAQSDSMYTAFVIMCLFYMLKNNIRIAMIFFGIGLSQKLQAIFPLPFILLFFVYRKISLKYLLYIPVGLFAATIPAQLFGWPFARIFIHFLAGTDINTSLTHNAPTIYAWPNIPALMPVIFITAILFCLGFLIIRKQSIPSHNTFLLLFLFCNFVIPFFLPNMHERYFFIGEIAVLLYAIANPKRYWISFLVIIPAVITYSSFLWNFRPFSLFHLSLVMLLPVIIISRWLVESIIADQGVKQ